MLSPKILGALILGVPLIVAAWALLWRQNRQVFYFALAAIVVGLGYLAATGATDEIAQRVVGQQPAPQSSTLKPAPAVAPKNNDPLPSEYSTK